MNRGPYKNPAQTSLLHVSSALRRRCDGEEMTLAKLVEICVESGQPRTPLAVTRLELSCQLFERIGECVAEYREVQQLHADRNRISRIENLSALKHLRCLYLQGNRIRAVEGLDGLRQLRLLHLGANQLTSLAGGGLERLPRLETLLVPDNILAGADAVRCLAGCTALCELDMGHNQLAEAEGVLQVLETVPQLQTLTLSGNPMTQTAAAAAAVAATAPGAAPTGATAPGAAPHAPLAFYRRTVVARCRQLTALDHRAVFPQERRYAESWWEEQAQVQAQGLPRLLSATGPAPLSAAAGGAGGRTAADGESPVAGVCAAAAAADGVAGTPAAAATPSVPPCAVTPPPDMSRLPQDLLYPVLTRLDARSLVMSALACRHWCGVAAFPLAATRTARAQAALVDAAAAVPRLAEELMAAVTAGPGPGWGGDAGGGPAAEARSGAEQLQELLTLRTPARPLVQLFFSLQVLWDTYVRRSARRAAAAAVAVAACDTVCDAGADASAAAGCETGAHPGLSDQLITSPCHSHSSPGGRLARGAGKRNVEAAAAAAAAADAGGAGAHLDSCSAAEDQDSETDLALALALSLQQDVEEVAVVAEQQAREGGQPWSPGWSHHTAAEGAADVSGGAVWAIRVLGGAAAADPGHGAGGSAAAGPQAAAGPPSGVVEAAAEPVAEAPADGGGGDEEEQEQEEGEGAGEAAGAEPPTPEGLAADPALDPALGPVLEPGSDSEADEGCSDLEVAETDMDSHAWRMAAWEQAQHLLRARAFALPALPAALPLGPRALALLRSRTGSADDLEFYVPQLRPQDVARYNASAGRLAEWLLGVEVHCRAAHELDAAAAWAWPRQLIARQAAELAAQQQQQQRQWQLAGEQGPEASAAKAGGLQAARACVATAPAADEAAPAAASPPPAEGEGGRGGARDVRRWPAATAAALEMRAALGRMLAARRAEARARAAAAAAARAAAEAAAVAAAAAAAAEAEAVAATVGDAVVEVAAGTGSTGVAAAPPGPNAAADGVGHGGGGGSSAGISSSESRR